MEMTTLKMKSTLTTNLAGLLTIIGMLHLTTRNLAHLMKNRNAIHGCHQKVLDTRVMTECNEHEFRIGRASAIEKAALTRGVSAKISNLSPVVFRLTTAFLLYLLAQANCKQSVRDHDAKRFRDTIRKNAFKNSSKAPTSTTLRNGTVLSAPSSIHSHKLLVKCQSGH